METTIDVSANISSEKYLSLYDHFIDINKAKAQILGVGAIVAQLDTFEIEKEAYIRVESALIILNSQFRGTTEIQAPYTFISRSKMQDIHLDAFPGVKTQIISLKETIVEGDLVFLDKAKGCTLKLILDKTSSIKGKVQGAKITPASKY
jgi:hypothetical protein